MHVFPAGNLRKKNKGFTLVELVIVIAIFSVLLGIVVPNLSSILGFRGKRAASSITAALDKTKTEAMNRLVGEMKLSCKSDGYYITYYLDHGSSAATTEDSPEKIAPSSVKISYTTSKDGSTKELTQGNSLIITYNRETGAFRPLQSAVLEQSEINSMLAGTYNYSGEASVVQSKRSARDIEFKDTDEYLETITVASGSKKRVITLNKDTGTYTLTVS